MMYEVTPTGTVLRKIDPTPTPEQLKAREDENGFIRLDSKLAVAPGDNT